jgi:hypothetical protein
MPVESAGSRPPSTGSAEEKIMSRSWMRAGAFALATLVLCALAVSCGDDSNRNRTAATEPSLTSSTTTFPAQVAGSPDRVAVFGTAVSFDGGTLVVQMPPVIVPDREPTVYRRIPVPGMGDVAGQRLRVTIDDSTGLRLQDAGLESVPAGTPLLVAGFVARATLVAREVVDMRLVEAYRRSPEAGPIPRTTGALREIPPEESPLRFLPPALVPKPGPSAAPAFAVVADSDSVAFKGGLGGASWGVSTGVPRICVPLLGCTPRVSFESMELSLGLGGGSYNFPFTFAAHPDAPLRVDTAGFVNLGITPKAPGGATPSYQWIMGTAAVAWIDVGSGRYADALQEFTTMFEYRGAAPMPGQTKELPHPACPSIDVADIPFVPVLGVRICEEQTIHGDHFGVNAVTARDSLYLPLQPGARYFRTSQCCVPFDGTHALRIPVNPATNPLAVDLSDFAYAPQMDCGISVEAYVFDQTVLSTPTLNPFTGMSMSFIPPDYEDCKVVFTNGTCGHQRSAVYLALPVVPVVTSVTATPYLSRVGDPVVLEALVRGANGPGSSPKEVSFYDGDALLGVAPIDGQDVARLSVSTLSPCRHEIRARFVGMDEEGTAYPSEKTTVALVTGDATMARFEGFWQHQMKGNGATAYDPGTLSCYLAVAGELSAVFGEHRDAATPGDAYDVLFLQQNGGSALEQLDRELLVAWLNVAAGGLRWDQGVDLNHDGIPDATCMDVLHHAESVRCDPSATEAECLEQARIVHTMKAMMPGGPGTPESQIVPGNKQRPGEVTSGF